MKIKRFFAPDIRQAMRLVREEQGPDAVILSNRSVDGGIEIVAARDFDEQIIRDNLRSNSATDAPSVGGESEIHQQQALKTKKIKQNYGLIEVLDENPRKHSDQQDKELSLSPLANTIKPRIKPNKKGKEQAEKPKTMIEKIKPANPVLVEMRGEINRMRKVLDTRLAEVAWTSSVSRNPIRIDVLRKLCDLGFSKALSSSIANGIDGSSDSSAAWLTAKNNLMKRLTVMDDNLLDYGGILALVGPTGVGKTTTIAKLAARFRIKHGPRKMALVTTDNNRIAAHEQITTYARLLDIPVRIAHNSSELQNILNGFIDKRLVLIDTAGMSQHDMRLAEQFSMLRDSQMPIKSYLVLSASSQRRCLNEVINAFQGFAPEACILTKLDEAASYGAALSSIIEHQLPLSFVADGQQVPEDLHIARPLELINQCLSVERGESDDGINEVDAFSYEDWVTMAHV